MTGPVDRPLRTIVVDPSEAFRERAVHWAAERGELAVVATAADGLAALASLERAAPDLVLTEAVLPGEAPLALLRAIVGRRPSPLVVVTTFGASSALRERAFALGAAGFVPKEDFADAFELLLGQLLEVRAAGRRGATTPARSGRPGSRTEPDP